MAPVSSLDRSRVDRSIDLALFAVAALCAATTLWFSFGAPPPGASLFPGADKVGHAIAYFATTLSFLLAAVWRPRGGQRRFSRSGWLFPVAAVLAGVAIEIIQGLDPPRSAEVGDVVAEIIGAGIATALFALVRWRFMRHRG
jgi:VanZ family protein